MAKEKARRSKGRSTAPEAVHLAGQYNDIGIKAVAAAAQQKESNIEKHKKAGGKPMNEIKEARDSIDKRTKAAREAFEEGGAAIQQNFSAALDKTRDLNFKLIEMARANAEATFDLAHEMMAAKNPSDLTQALSTHATKQFERLNMQMSELSSVAQTIIGSGTEPLARSFNQAFKGGT